MTDTTKLPEALRIAGILRVTGPRHMTSKWIGEAFLELERQHDRIAELEARLEAVGAGGVGAMLPKPCDHQFYLFGTEQKRRRCNLCNILEPDQSESAAVEPADRHLPQNVAELLIDYFLRDELSVKCPPPVTLENQGEGESESHIWAFWIEENDTTSYLGEDGRIQWFGTAWTPDTPKPHQVAETCPVAPSIPGLPRDVVKLLIALATPSMYPRLLPLLEWVKNQPPQIAEPASDKIAVDKAALREVLQALIGPGHYIRELQATRNLPIGPKNPINVLVDEFNATIEAATKEPS